MLVIICIYSVRKSGEKIISLNEYLIDKTRGAQLMLEHSIAKRTIASIRSKKLNLNPNTELTERIKLLQREMVKLSFQKNKKHEISLVLEEIQRLRAVLKLSQ